MSTPRARAILAQLSSKHEAVSAAEERTHSPPPTTNNATPAAFLAAAKGDAAAAATRWSVTREWRAAHRIDRLLEEPDLGAFEAIRAHLPHTIGRDADGLAVLYVRVGHLALDGLRARLGGETRECLLRHACLLLEWIRNKEDRGKTMRGNRPPPKHDSSMIKVVIDLDRLGAMNRSAVRAALELLRALSDMLQAHYPETLHTLFVVLGPSKVVERLFNVVWRAARRFIDASTTAKVRVIRGGGTPAPKQLSVYGIPRASVPTFLGGGGAAHMTGRSADDAALEEWVRAHAYGARGACGWGSSGASESEEGVEDEDAEDTSLEILRDPYGDGGDGGASDGSADHGGGAFPPGSIASSAVSPAVSPAKAPPPSPVRRTATRHSRGESLAGTFRDAGLSSLEDEWLSASTPAQLAFDYESALVELNEMRASSCWGLHLLESCAALRKWRRRSTFVPPPMALIVQSN